MQITQPLEGSYLDKNQCYPFNLKWLNDLGGWESHTFEAGKREEIIFSENERYKKEVFGNWSNGFTQSSGTSFEQYIDYNERITVRTRMISKELKQTLSTIKTSIHVTYWNEELQRYLTCLADKSSFIVLEDTEGTYTFEFNILLNDRYVQNA